MYAMFPKYAFQIRLGIRFGSIRRSVLDPFWDAFGIQPSQPQTRRPGERIQNGSPKRTPSRPAADPRTHVSLDRDAVLDPFGDPFRIRSGIRLQIPPGLGPKRIPKQIPKRIENGSKTHPSRGKRVPGDPPGDKTHLTPKRTSNGPQNTSHTDTKTHPKRIPPCM